MLVSLLINPNDRPDEAWADPRRGNIRWRTLLSSDVMESDMFTASILSLAADDHCAAHRHAEVELYFGLSGEADIEVENKLYHLKPKSLLYILGNAFHGIPPTSGPLRLFYTFAKDRLDAVEYPFRRRYVLDATSWEAQQGRDLKTPI